MSAVQPVPAPTTWAEYELIRPQLVDTLGRPLVSAWCDSCQCRHFTVDPCVAEVPCPVCGSTRARCVRPSEHEADSWHKDRRPLRAAARRAGSCRHPRRLHAGPSAAEGPPDKLKIWRPAVERKFLHGSPLELVDLTID